MIVGIACGHPVGNLQWAGVDGDRTYCETCSRVRMVYNKVVSKGDGARGTVVEAQGPVVLVAWDNPELGSFTVFQSCLELI